MLFSTGRLLWLAFAADGAEFLGQNREYYLCDLQLIVVLGKLKKSQTDVLYLSVTISYLC